MRAVGILCGLTIQEAMRRRVWVASLLVFVLIALLSLLRATGRHHFDPNSAMDPDQTAKILAWTGCGCIKFFSSILAITLTAGAISSEIEKGVLSIIVPKPLGRWSIYLGRWLGVLVIVGVSVALWSGLLAVMIYHLTGYFHPRMFLGIAAACLFPILFATLTLFFSTFGTFAFAAGLSLVFAGMAMAHDMLLWLSSILNQPVLKTIADILGFLVPLGRMNHWITRALGDSGTDLSALSATLIDPVTATWGDLAYIFCYITGIFFLGMWIFRNRDL